MSKVTSSNKKQDAVESDDCPHSEKTWSIKKEVYQRLWSNRSKITHLVGKWKLLEFDPNRLSYEFKQDSDEARKKLFLSR